MGNRRFARGTFEEATPPLASAATVDIGGTITLKVAISGSATVTSFGTVADKWRFVRFTGAATLTHNATSLILPGGANIVTAAGDTLIAASDSSGNWRVLHYQRASGRGLAVDGQIAFPASQNASSDANTLDDYEEGTWTPALSFTTPPTGLVYSQQTGRYTKIGRLVSISFGIVLSAKGTGGAGAATITGLPFTAGAAAQFSTVFNNVSLTASFTFANTQIAAGTAIVSLMQMGSAQAASSITWTLLADSSYMFGSGVFSV